MSDEVVSKADYDWMVVDRDTWHAVSQEVISERDAARAMIEKLTKSFNMTRPFKRPAEDRQTAELGRQQDDTKTAHVVAQQLLGQVIQERDESRKEASRLHEAGNGLIAQLNAAQTEIERLTADNCRLVDERDAANQAAEISYQKLQQALLECDTTRADVLRLSAERDAAEREKQLTWENLQRMIRKCDAVILERDVSRDENYRLREERNNLHKENEGLRADALAYPPQRIDPKQYADLKADHELQAIMIETLQEGLKRTETRLAKSQAAQDIDPRLKGFLATISQLADQSQDMLP